MSGEIDNKIRTEIEAKAGYSLVVFASRFNDGANDAVRIFKEVFAHYNRYMTQDYYSTILGLNRWKISKILNER